MKNQRLFLFILALIGTNIIFKLVLNFIPFIAALFISFIASLFISVLYPDDLNSIKATKVGDNQHGSSRFATDKEKHTYYNFTTAEKAKNSGFVIGRNRNEYIVDSSDTSCTLVAPPGAGKTKCILIPTLKYNAQVNSNTSGKGASILTTDLKGELYETTKDFMQKAGYKTPFLDFSNPLNSANYNIMYKINHFIDIYLNEQTSSQDKVIAYSKAERYAKTLAESIVDNVEGAKSETSSFFTETAKGLVTGITLLVSEYGEKNARHIVSVFKLIIELNGLTEDSTDQIQKSKLSSLLENIDNERILNYVGPSMSADTRTSMNVFSSALSKLVSFIDAEFEQMICSHSEEFNDVDFIENPTIIYIVCPDENTTRHFFASLFIRFLMNDLIEQSRETNGVLNRKVLCLWDEFGNMPAIKNLDILLTAARSRGIRFMLTLQSFAQLEKSYPKSSSKIILDSAQSLLFTYIAPTARETAETLSKILGNKTIKTGSVSVGKSYQTSYQMTSRELLKPDEIMKIPQTHFISIKAGQYPSQVIAPFYFKYFDVNLEKPQATKKTLEDISYLDTEFLIRHHKADIRLFRGMFD